jgi:SAM-dependent methyltransferase
MSEIVQVCPLCDSFESALFDQREFHGHQVTNRICRNCGLVFQSPRMTAAELDQFYEADYRSMYQGDEGPSLKDINVQMARTISLSSFVKGHINNLHGHLDIGSSTGELLLGFQKSFSTQPFGVEPGESYRRYAQDQGLEVFASLDALQNAKESRFDLITMAHVLEHLPDPVAYLIKLREIFLAPKGWLLLEVPNLYAHDSFEVAHLFAFSAHTLKQTVQRAGFGVVALEKHGLPRSLALPLYLTMLARPALVKKLVPLRLERGVSLKRRLGMSRRRVLSLLFPRRAWIPES